jgi:two-component sensor histidine kinase
MKAARATWGKLTPLAKAWVLSFICWGIVACSLGLENAMRTQNLWTGMIRPGIRNWLPWAILSPLLFRLVQRMPIDRQRSRLTLPIHILCAIATVLLCQYWKQTVDWKLGRTPPPLPPDLWALTILSGGPPGAVLGMNRPPLPPPYDSVGGPERGPAFFEPPRRIFDMLRMATFDLPIYLMLVSGAHTLTFYRRTQERESSLAVARAEAQKMQLQPHFLFNTLNMIAELVHEEPNKADTMLIALSGLLRLTMETAGEQELPLRRELEFIERYLTIMHARFEDRLKFQLGIDPATHAALVPTFLLQPLVENAIEHGLGPRMAGGLISIRSRRVGSELQLCVSDNGAGLNGQKPGPEGIGLGNTRNRLRELYGDAAELTMQDTGGLIVDIRLPFHLE